MSESVRTYKMEELDEMFSESRMFRQRLLYISIPLSILIFSGLIPEGSLPFILFFRVIGIFASIPLFLVRIPPGYFGIEHTFMERTGVRTGEINAPFWGYQLRWPWISILLVSQRPFIISFFREPLVRDGHFYFKLRMRARACPDIHDNGVHPFVGMSDYPKTLGIVLESELGVVCNLCRKLSSEFLKKHHEAIDLYALCLAKLKIPPHEVNSPGGEMPEVSPEETILFYEDNRNSILSKYDIQDEARISGASYFKTHYKEFDSLADLLRHIPDFPYCLSFLESTFGIEILNVEVETHKTLERFW